MNSVALLQVILDSEGLLMEEFMEQCIYDTMCPGICTDPDCHAVASSVETDCVKGWCEMCGKSTVVSGLELIL